MRRVTLMLILTLPLAGGCIALFGSGESARTGGSGSTGVIFLLFLLAIGLCALSRKSPHER